MVQFLKSYYFRLNGTQKVAYWCYGYFFGSLLFSSALDFACRNGYTLSDSNFLVLVIYFGLYVFSLPAGIVALINSCGSFFKKFDWGLLVLTIIILVVFGLWFWNSPWTFGL